MSQPSVISLFTGAWGLDLGLEAAGFKTRVAVEFDTTCAQTLRHNRPWNVIEGDIHGVTSKQILKVAGLKEGEADPPALLERRQGHRHQAVNPQILSLFAFQPFLRPKLRAKTPYQP